MLAMNSACSWARRAVRRRMNTVIDEPVTANTAKHNTSTPKATSHAAR
jgi:hypothetical protein